MSMSMILRYDQGESLCIAPPISGKMKANDFISHKDSGSTCVLVWGGSSKEIVYVLVCVCVCVRPPAAPEGGGPCVDRADAQ